MNSQVQNIIVGAEKRGWRSN